LDSEVNGEVKEFNDHIEIDGMTFNKPFVEKPVSAGQLEVALSQWKLKSDSDLRRP